MLQPSLSDFRAFGLPTPPVFSSDCGRPKAHGDHLCGLWATGEICDLMRQGTLPQRLFSSPQLGSSWKNKSGGVRERTRVAATQISLLFKIKVLFLARRQCSWILALSPLLVISSIWLGSVLMDHWLLNTPSHLFTGQSRLFLELGWNYLLRQRCQTTRELERMESTTHTSVKRKMISCSGK